VLTFTVFIALGKAEVYDVDIVFGGVRATNQEVVRFDISMYDSFFVHFFNAFDHLNCNHEDSFQVQVTLASLQKVFKGRSKEVHNHNVELVVSD